MRDSAKWQSNSLESEAGLEQRHARVHPFEEACGRTITIVAGKPGCDCHADDRTGEGQHGIVTGGSAGALPYELGALPPFSRTH